MSDQTQMTQLIFVFCLSTFMLASIIILFISLYKRKISEKNAELQLQMKNQELEILKTIVVTQENEREKIANDLHDDIGPLLTVLKLQLSQNKRNLKENKLKEESLVSNIKIIDDVITNIRSVSSELSPNQVIKFGIYKALNQFGNIIQQASGIQTSVETNYDPNKLLDKHFSLNLYRVCIELVNNILKHSNATYLNIELELNEKFLTLVIRHDGKGLTHNEYLNLLNSSQGLGINSISSRILLLNGIIKFEKNQESNDSAILIKVPYEEKDQNSNGG